MATSIIGTQQRAYGIGQGLQPIPPFTIVAQRAPTTSDRANIGTFWIYTVSNDCYVLTSINNGISNWVSFNQGGTGQFSSLVITTGPNTIAGLTTFNGNVVFNGNITQAAGVTSLLQTLITGSLSQDGGATLLNTDAIAQTINIGTGAADKTVTLGSTNTTSTTTINSGSGNITMNGTVLAPSQPSFNAFLQPGVINQTGNSGSPDILFNNVSQVGTAYNAATGEFTAPVTGRYLIGARVTVNNLSAPMSNGYLQIDKYPPVGAVPNVSEVCGLCNPVACMTATTSPDRYTFQGQTVLGMAVGERIKIHCVVKDGGANTAGYSGAGERETLFYGQLLS